MPETVPDQTLQDPVDARARRCLTPTLSSRFGAVPIALARHEITFATLGESQPESARALQFLAGLVAEPPPACRFVAVDAVAFSDLRERTYGPAGTPEAAVDGDALGGFLEAAVAAPGAWLRLPSGSRAAHAFVDQLLNAAVRTSATHVALEQLSDRTRVRRRRGGRWEPASTGLPPAFGLQVFAAVRERATRSGAGGDEAQFEHRGVVDGMVRVVACRASFARTTEGEMVSIEIPPPDAGPA